MTKVIINEEDGMNELLKQSFGGPDDPNYSLWKYVTRVDYPQRQIIRFTGNNRFVEFLSNAMPIDRIKVVISDYDQKKPKGQRIGKTFEYYLDFYECLRLSESILSGRLVEFIAKEKAKSAQSKSYYMRNAWETFGGKNAIDLAKAGKKRDDGKSLFRKLTIMPSIKDGYAAAIQIEQGPGKMGQYNGVMPEYKNVRELKGPDGYLMVPLTKADFMELAVALKLHIEAYYAAKYAMVSQIEIINYFKSYMDIEMSKQNKMMKILYEQNIKLANALNQVPEKINSNNPLPIDEKKKDMVNPTVPKMEVDDMPQTQDIVNDSYTGTNDDIVPF